MSTPTLLSIALRNFEITPRVLLEALSSNRTGYATGVVREGYFQLDLLQLGDRLMVMVRLWQDSSRRQPATQLNGREALTLYRDHPNETVAQWTFGGGVAVVELALSELFVDTPLFLTVERVPPLMA